MNGAIAASTATTVRTQKQRRIESAAQNVQQYRNAVITMKELWHIVRIDAQIP